MMAEPVSGVCAVAQTSSLSDQGSKYEMFGFCESLTLPLYFGGTRRWEILTTFGQKKTKVSKTSYFR